MTWPAPTIELLAHPGALPGAGMSRLDDDAELRELVAQFVGELPDRLAALCAAAQAKKSEEVRRLAHQLKGAGGSYGFPELTAAAAALEEASRAVGSERLLNLALDSLAVLVERLRSDRESVTNGRAGR